MLLGTRPPAARRPLVAALALIGGMAAVAAAPFAADGIYTKEQAERGRATYDIECASCHGDRLEGGESPPLTGERFLASWGRPNLTLDDLYYTIRKTMPKEGPGTLTRQEYTDVVAYLLQQNGFAPGDKELTPDPVVMKAVRFEAPAPRNPSNSPHR
jgi:mono/diheme cytochrome c family protein